MKKFFEKGKKLYWWLIGTFAMLYLAVAFVSTLHAITFFQLANTLGLAILLGAAYEIGQAAVLFSILMSQNRNRILAWSMMFLLTALQVTANVYASFKFMDGSQSLDWQYWQRAILFGVQADAETYKVIISWISGALLPLVALGMTALVADNIRMATGEIKPAEKKEEDEEAEDEGRLWGKKKKEEIIIPDNTNVFLPESDHREMKLDYTPEMIETIKEMKPMDYTEPVKEEEIIVQEEISEEEFPEGSGIIAEKIEDRKPVNKIVGWHFMNEFIDQDHNIFKKGKWMGKDLSKIPTEPKKA